MWFISEGIAKPVRSAMSCSIFCLLFFFSIESVKIAYQAAVLLMSCRESGFVVIKCGFERDVQTWGIASREGWWIEWSCAVCRARSPSAGWGEDGSVVSINARFACRPWATRTGTYAATSGEVRRQD